MNVTPIDKHESPEPPWKLYVAAGFGAFCLGFGDLLNNDKAATVLKISEVVRQHIWTGLEIGGLVALLVLVVLGPCFCWIHQPRTRIDAFSRGFSVFALLAVAAPFHPVGKGLDSSTGGKQAEISFFRLVASAHAAETVLPSPIEPKAEASGGPSSGPAPKTESTTPVVKIEPIFAATDVKNATVTIRDIRTGKILGWEQVGAKEFTISRPKGEYLIELEALDTGEPRRS
ncbi:MAG: hypothetical protein ACREI2_14775 [Nitrospiraceae bacterium]